jgi:hypothetical protein
MFLAGIIRAALAWWPCPEWNILYILGGMIISSSHHLLLFSSPFFFRSSLHNLIHNSRRAPPLQKRFTFTGCNSVSGAYTVGNEKIG